MGYPWGKAPLADGTGTTPADMQRIIGAQYMNGGILPNGGLTVEGTSSMAYKVNPGAAFMWTSHAARLGMLVPVEGTTVNTAPAPATGSRIDTVYVNGSGAVGVVQGTDIPSGVAIARFTVPAGIVATSSAIMSIDRNFAIPTGASLGRLAHWRDPGGGAASPAESTKMVSRFHLPSDRLVEVRVSTTIKSATSTPGEMYFEAHLESSAGSVRRTMFVAHTPAWDSRSASWSFGTAEGANVLTVKTKGVSGGNWQFSKGDSTTEVSLWDQGVLR